jgi:exonuclease III
VTTQNGITFLYSAIAGENAEHKDGVRMLLSRGAMNSLMDWKPILERIMTACFRTQIRNVTVIQCYAPTETTKINKKEESYQQLNETIKKVRKRDIILMGA